MGKTTDTAGTNYELKGDERLLEILWDMLGPAAWNLPILKSTPIPCVLTTVACPRKTRLLDQEHIQAREFIY